MTFLHRFWPAIAVVAVLSAVLLLEIAPYGYRLTAVFHMDAITATGNPMPEDFVILSIPSYDGAQYYQVARNMPRIFDPSRWSELRVRNPGSYAYQRFLLPLTSYVAAFGQTWLLPYTFVGINMLALLLVTLLLLHHKVKPVYALALAFSPAAMLAMHFTLAEPLTILLIAFVLVRLDKGRPVDVWVLAALCLAVLAREVNSLFVLYLLGWSLLNRRWSDFAKLLLPAAVFLGWHAALYGMFGNIPFFTSTGARQFPASAAAKLLLGMKGYDAMSFSSIGLILLFVFPCLAFVIRDIWQRRKADLLSLGALCFLCLMLLMPDYIWGSITSIGRVITPVYPLSILLLAGRDGPVARTLALGILTLGLVTGIGLALIVHPFTLA